MIATWKQEEVDDYIIQVREHSQNNFLYLYYFFKESAVSAGTKHIDLRSFGIPRGLSEIYRSFAVEKIRKNVESTIHITAMEKIPISLLVQLKSVPNISMVEIVERDILLITSDSDQVTPALFSLLLSAGVQLIKFQTQKAEQLGVWEEKYLPILGIMAVAYQPLYREQIAGFAVVEVVYVDSVLTQLKQFLDEVIDEQATAYQFYHTSFSEYLLDSQQNRDYPLDGPKYHVQIASYYRMGKATWKEVDWEKLIDRYPFSYLPAHLKAAGQAEELYALLLDFAWIAAKLNATDIHALISDYNLALLADFPLMEQERTLRLLREALQLSKHILRRDSSQLAGQLLGRLQSYDVPLLLPLLKQAVQWKAVPWLHPLTPSLVVPGGPLLHTITGHTGPLRALALLPNGQHVVSASTDKTLKVWDITSAMELCTLTGHKDGVTAVAVTPDGRRIISGSWDGELKVWDLESGAEVLTWKGDEVMRTDFDCIAMMPDGRRIVTVSSDDHKLRIWDLESGMNLRTFKVLPHGTSLMARTPTTVAITPDGRYAVTAGYLDFFRFVGQGTESAILVWDLESGEELRALTGHTAPVRALAITPDSRYVISAAGATFDFSTHPSSDNTLKVWDLKREVGRPIQAGHSGRVNDIVITQNGRHAVTAAGMPTSWGKGSDNTLKVWDLSTGEELSTLVGHTGAVKAVEVTPDGHYAVSADNSGKLIVWDLENRELLDTRVGSIYGEVTIMVLTPDGRYVITAEGDWEPTDPCDTWEDISDCSLKVWDLENRKSKPISIFEGHHGQVSALAITPDGRRAVSAALDKTLIVWDIASGMQQYIFTGHSEAISAVTVTPNGRYVISEANRDNTSSVWDLEKGAELLTMLPYGHVVAIAPDSKRVISVSVSGTLTVWELENGTELLTMPSYGRVVAVTPDRRRFVSISSEETLNVWDIEVRKILASFSGDSALSTCAIGSDGMTIVAGEETGSVHILHLEWIGEDNRKTSLS